MSTGRSEENKTLLTTIEIESIVEEKMRKTTAVGANRAYQRILLRNVMHGLQSSNPVYVRWAQTLSDETITHFDKKGSSNAIGVMPGNIAMESHQLATFGVPKE